MPQSFGRLIEPFSGTAAITLAAANRGMGEAYVVNDLNAPLVGMLEEAVENPARLHQNYRELWEAQFTHPEGDVEHYYHVRRLFNEGDKSPEKMLYLLARCVKGAVRYSREGLFNQSPDKRRHGTNPDKIHANLVKMSALLKGRTTFHCKDYREILEMAGKDDIVYMDPPYQGVSSARDNRYIGGLDHDEFVKSVIALDKREVPYIISYDGACGSRSYGKLLPTSLRCQRIDLDAGVSSQSTLLGKRDITTESLYVGDSLLARVGQLGLEVAGAK